MKNLPDYQDIIRAAERIDGIAVKTGLLQNSELNALTGANVFIKPENLQKTGSFKFRGAYNAISALGAEQRKAGVVACSSGNHAQGIAEAARLLGVPATIVMPQDSPEIKVQRTRRSGAQIVLYDREVEDRDEIAQRLCAAQNASFIHPFENPDVIAGQGTTGLEICQQLEQLGQTPDRVLVCTGGGGLTAGLSLALTHHFPTVKIHSVEPEGFDDYRRSLSAGTRTSNKQKSGSICDALLTETPGETGFAINKNLLAEGLYVSDQQALQAVKIAFEELKLVVEPGGAVALAALLQAGKLWQGETIICILSGGNIDPDMMAKALSA